VVQSIGSRSWKRVGHGQRCIPPEPITRGSPHWPREAERFGNQCAEFLLKYFLFSQQILLCSQNIASRGNVVVLAITYD